MMVPRSRVLFFFFSSRRRHTRSDRDWSSDVCSSDLNHATKNPNAHFSKGATLDQVLGSRMIATPLRLFMCSPITDGAAAVILASEDRSEEHTSELQSRSDLVCRLLLEKKKKKSQRTEISEKHRGKSRCSMSKAMGS